MNQRILAIVFFSAATTCRALAAAVTDDPADPSVMEVRAREEDYTRGVRNKDIDLLSTVFAESFIDASETGKLINKQQYFLELKADRSTIESLVTDEFKIWSTAMQLSPVLASS